MTERDNEVKIYANVYGGGTRCSDGERHRPSLSQSGGLLRCVRCGANLRETLGP